VATRKRGLRWAGPIPEADIKRTGGEYVSVHSQADTEQADLKLEHAELKADDKGEHKELQAIYVERGLDRSLAKQVATQLMDHDALGAHARDELGISETLRARPLQAAWASAGSFAVGAVLPLAVTAVAPEARLIPLVAGTSLLFLAILGGLAAQAGGAKVMIGAVRVTFWGALAMAITLGIGWLFGTVACVGPSEAFPVTCLPQTVPSKQRVSPIKPGFHTLHHE